MRRWVGHEITKRSFATVQRTDRVHHHQPKRLTRTLWGVDIAEYGGSQFVGPLTHHQLLGVVHIADLGQPRGPLPRRGRGGIGHHRQREVTWSVECAGLGHQRSGNAAGNGPGTAQSHHRGPVQWHGHGDICEGSLEVEHGLDPCRTITSWFAQWVHRRNGAATHTQLHPVPVVTTPFPQAHGG